MSRRDFMMMMMIKTRQSEFTHTHKTKKNTKKSTTKIMAFVS